ncbi:LEAF RUST 10 DISEASE-RESISTANCE LOCUS RECEPTOR-LIKE PROTEIN KINASE-like 1.2 [Jatropha curcas]|uniref:LEAF RUST 10 DISEASE-RESISTANCE LOCUS RECEPTOR-LIKE PROTEIN KINASE-like 1.2 n=1 Tax=Jatropha curcas TaxID=180498 RepID=UPI0018946667|nr:LEAF RUST 10 DISEASE-RESISTANCE LOCUS RECEPTOR-LIKE PROTEIN KINASE-like 1.2 [Jatropha curcas]
MSLHILFNFFIIILSVDLVLSAESKYEACKPKNCGTGPNISYPFYIRKNHTDYCGHPGFNVLCENRKPIYKTSRAHYIIQNINYENQSFRLIDTEILDSTCPTPSKNYTFDRSSVDFSPYHADIFFFYNCNTSISANYKESGIPCNGKSKNETFIALVPRDEPLNWNLKACESIVAAPVQLEQENINQTIVHVDYKKLLKNGFTLKWIGLGYSCGECQRSGGHCGFEEGNSVCYCPDGSHPKHCNDGKAFLC